MKSYWKQKNYWGLHIKQAPINKRPFKQQYWYLHWGRT